MKIRRGLDNPANLSTVLSEQIPDGFVLGTADDQGDCFFDALAQAMNSIRETNIYKTKYLRGLCHAFYLENQELVSQWNQEDYNSNIISNYLTIQYTAKECEKLKVTPLWGRPSIEGKILCHQLQLKAICIIEILEDPETKKPVLSFYLTNKYSHQNINEKEAKKWLKKSIIPVLVVEQKSLHFVPLLGYKKNSLHEKSSHRNANIKLENIKAENITLVATGTSPSIEGKKISTKNLSAVSSHSNTSPTSYKKVQNALATFNLEPQTSGNAINASSPQVGYHQPVNVQAVAINSTMEISVLAKFKYPLHVKEFIEKMKNDPDNIRYHVGNIPEVSPHYTGREDALTSLSTYLNTNDICAVTNQEKIFKQSVNGYGGVGKTQLIAKYLKQYSVKYNIVVWIDCSPESLEADIYYSAEQLGVSYDKSWPLEKIASNIYQQLSQVKRALIVFDGVIEPAMVQTLLPSANKLGLNQKNNQLHCIITSQYREWEKCGIKQSLELPVFSIKESRQFINSVLHQTFSLPIDVAVLDITVLNLFDQISVEVAYLPLALDQATAYIRVVLNDYPIEYALNEYLEELKKKHLQWLEISEAMRDDHSKTVLTTFRITLEHFVNSKDKQLCLDTLGICGVLPVDITYEFLQAHLQIDLMDLRHKVLRILKTFSLISLRNPVNKISMHSMMKLALQYWLREPAKIITTPISVCGFIADDRLLDNLYQKTVEIMSDEAEERIKQPLEMQRRQRLLPLTKVLIETYEKAPENKKYATAFLQAYANLLEKNLTICCENQDLRSFTLNRYLNFIKKHDLQLQTPADLLNYLEAISKAVSEVLDNQGNHFQWTVDVNKHCTGNILNDERYFQIHNLINSFKAFLAYIKNYENNNPETFQKIALDSHKGNGFIYKAIGNFPKSLKHHEIYLMLVKNRYGEQHIKVAEILSIMGNTYHKLGQVSRGNELAHQAMDIALKSDERSHPLMAEILTTHASTESNRQEKINLLEQSLMIYTAYYGENHLCVFTTLNYLQMNYGLLHQYDKQKAILERSLDILNVLGEEHEHLRIELLLKLCKINKQLNLNTQEIADEIFILLETSPSPTSGKEAIGRSIILGELLGIVGSVEQQEAILKMTLPIVKEMYGELHPVNLDILTQLSNIYQKKGQLADAVECIELVVHILKNSYGEDDLRTGTRLTVLALLYSEIGNISDSESCLIKALAIEEKNCGKNGFGSVQILHGLANLYEQTDIEKASAYLARALVIAEKFLEPTNLQMVTLLMSQMRVYGLLGNTPEKLNLLYKVKSLCELSPLINERYGTNVNNLIRVEEDLQNHLHSLDILLNHSGELTEELDQEQSEIMDFLQKMLKGGSLLTDNNLEKMQQMLAESSDMLLMKAYSAIQKNDVLAAIEICQKVLEKSPLRSDAHHMLASCYLSLNNKDLARIHYEKALQEPHKSSLEFDYALFLFMDGNFNKALQYCYLSFNSAETCQEFLNLYTPYLEYTLQVLMHIHPQMKMPIACMAYFLAFRCQQELNADFSLLLDLVSQFSAYVGKTENGVAMYLLATCYQNIGEEDLANAAYCMAYEYESSLQGLKEEPLNPALLLEVRNTDKTDYLIRLSYDPRPLVRIAGIKAICKTELQNEGKLLQRLFYLLEDSNNDVRLQVEATLMQFKHLIDESRLALLTHELDEVVLIALKLMIQLEQFLEPDIKELLQEFKNQDRIRSLLFYIKKQNDKENINLSSNSPFYHSINIIESENIVIDMKKESTIVPGIQQDSSGEFVSQYGWRGNKH